MQNEDATKGPLGFRTRGDFAYYPNPMMECKKIKKRKDQQYSYWKECEGGRQDPMTFSSDLIPITDGASCTQRLESSLLHRRT
jgi:hypothetical protein